MPAQPRCQPLADDAVRQLHQKALSTGERLEILAGRTGNVWSPAYTALVNGLEVEAALRDGQLVKIARQEPARD